MLTKSLAYEKWLGIKAEHQPPSLYRLLAIDAFEADKEIIANAADSRLGFVRQFQIGENSKLAAEILNEIARAQVILLNPQKKGAYDAQLRSSEGKAADAGHGPAPQGAPPPLPAASAATKIVRAVPLNPVQSTSESDQEQQPDVDIDSLISAAAPTSSIQRKRHSSARKPTRPIVPIATAFAIAVGCVIAGLVYFHTRNQQASPDNAARVAAANPAKNEQARGSASQAPAGRTGGPTPDAGKPPAAAAPPQAVAVVERPYDDQRLAKELDEIKKQSKAVKTPDESRNVAEKAIVLADRAVVLGKPDMAKEVAALTLAAARTADAVPLARRATVFLIQLSSLQADALKEIAQKRLDATAGDNPAPVAAEPRFTGPSLQPDEKLGQVGSASGTHDARWGKTEAERRKIFFDLLKAVDDYGMTAEGRKAWKEIQARNGIDSRVTLGILNEGFGSFSNWEQPDGGGKASSRINRMEWIGARTRSMCEPMLN